MYRPRETLAFAEQRQTVANYARELASRHRLYPVPATILGPATTVDRYNQPRCPNDVYEAFYEYPETLLGFRTGPDTGLALLVDSSERDADPVNPLHHQLFSGTEHAVSKVVGRLIFSNEETRAKTILVRVGFRSFGKGIDTTLPLVEFAPDGHWAVFSPCEWSITDGSHLGFTYFTKNDGPADLLSVGVKTLSAETLSALLSGNRAEGF
jgi:hypothetical protein